MHSLILIIGVFCLNVYAQNNSSIPKIVETHCMSCHSNYTIIDSPLMAGQKKDFIAFELFNFRDKLRVHEIMNQVMEGYTDREVKEMAVYISKLSLCEAQAQVDEHPNANVEKGKEIFQGSCFACHQKDTFGIGPVLHGQKTWYIEYAIKSFQSSWHKPRPSRLNMKNHTDMLSEQDIKDVAAYLNEQKLCEISPLYY
ncbi:MAG: c-type cytochrome [Halobacteriovoraceae bacterium]|jgi:cytochrome c553|nr:c-type cytochrome [Halobacteriovoraceae bacterium]